MTHTRDMTRIAANTHTQGGSIFHTKQLVKVLTSCKNKTVFVTLDGSLPGLKNWSHTGASPLHLTISKTCSVRAVAIGEELLRILCVILHINCVSHTTYTFHMTRILHTTYTFHMTRILHTTYTFHMTHFAYNLHMTYYIYISYDTLRTHFILHVRCAMHITCLHSHSAMLR